MMISDGIIAVKDFSLRAFLAALLLLCSLSNAYTQGEPVSHSIVIKGIDIHYLETGRGPRTLILVHGWCGSSDDFLSMLRSMPPDIRCIAVDLPGCGESAKPDIEYSIPLFVDILFSFSAALGLESFALLGHSMGGQAAVHFVRQHPESVEKLILVDPYGLEGEEGAWLALTRIGPLIDAGFQLNNRLFIEIAVRVNLLFRPSNETVESLVNSTARNIIGPEASKATANITQNVIGHDPVDDILPAIAQSTLVVWGENDVLLPRRWAERFVALLPNASLSIVSESGHMPTREKPTEVAALIARFISQ
jgi:pimeloyl-ACP methyl ester carboxylesterase